MQPTILQIPLSRLTTINSELTEAFVQNLLKDIPALGKEASTYFIINNNVGIFNPNNLKHIEVFNLFLQISRQKFHLIQFTKS